MSRSSCSCAVPSGGGIPSQTARRARTGSCAPGGAYTAAPCVARPSSPPSPPSPWARRAAATRRTPPRWRRPPRRPRARPHADRRGLPAVLGAHARRAAPGQPGGPDPRAERLRPAAGDQPLRLRALRRRAQAGRRRARRDLRLAPRRDRAARPLPGAQRVARRQAAVPEPHDRRRPGRGQERLRREGARSPSPGATASRRWRSSTGGRSARRRSAPRSARRRRGLPAERRRRGAEGQHADDRRRRGDAERLSTRMPPATELIADRPRAGRTARSRSRCCSRRPALCQSRVCGPVVDVMEQVRSKGDFEDTAFISSEIYKENRVDQGLRPAPAGLPAPDGAVAVRPGPAGPRGRAHRGRVLRRRAAGRGAPGRAGRLTYDRPRSGPVAQLVRAADS